MEKAAAAIMLPLYSSLFDHLMGQSPAFLVGISPGERCAADSQVHNLRVRVGAWFKCASAMQQHQVFVSSPTTTCIVCLPPPRRAHEPHQRRRDGGLQPRDDNNIQGAARGGCLHA